MTLAEQLTARLRRAGLFQLFARKLGPRDLVFVAALGFDAGGRVFRIAGTHATLAGALLELLRAADVETAGVERPTSRSPRRPVRHEDDEEYYGRLRAKLESDAWSDDA